jgi:hypothetical protein
MIRLMAVAFALAVATSAQAMPLAPPHQPDGMITQVREACGAGSVRVNGVCVASVVPTLDLTQGAKLSEGQCVSSGIKLSLTSNAAAPQ